MSTILRPFPRSLLVRRKPRHILGRSIVTLLGPVIVGLGWMNMTDTAQATVTATESAGVLTVTVGAGGDNPTLSTTTSGGNIHVSGGGFTGDFASVTQIHINLAQNGETPTFDSTNFSFNAPVTITDTGGTGGDSITKIGAHNLTVTGASSYGSGTGINGGTLLVNNGSALGTGLVVVGAGAELRGVGTLIMGNVISLPSGGTGTISTAGTFTISDLSMQGDVNFGSTGNAGTVVVASNPGSVSSSASIDVAFGTLRNGGGLSYYTSGAGSTSVNSGATLSVNDLSMTVADLFGTGAVTLGTKAATLLTLGAGNFSGVISGAGQVKFTGGSTLSGTNTYTGGTTISGGTLAIGNGGTTGSVAGNIVDNSTLVFVRSNAMTYGGVISGTGAVTQGGTGVLSLTGNNTYSGGTTVHSGVLSFNSAHALGTGNITMAAGAELRGSGTVILANNLIFAPVSNSTLSTSGTLTVSSIEPGNGANMVFGSAGNAGVVVVSGGSPISPTVSAEVAYGTLRNGGGLDNLTQFASTTKVDAGATLSVNDQSMTVADLLGTGSVTLGTKASTFLTVNGGFFGGVISGAGQLTLPTAPIVEFTGANSYTGGTTISSGTLQIGNLGTTGSVVGNIVDNATLTFERSNTATYGGIISGPGVVNQAGTGVQSLTGNNTYTGGTTIQSGVVSINNGHALGTGDVTLDHGTELRSSGTVTLTNSVHFAAGNSKLSTNGTLTVNSLSMGGSTHAVFGSVGNAGVVVVGPGSNSISLTTTMEVAFGTLRNGGGLGSYTNFGDGTMVDAGATLSVNDLNMAVTGLSGPGAVTLGTKASTVLYLNSGNFSGVISGAGDVTKQTAMGSAVTLTGANTYTGGTTITSGTLQIGGGGLTGSIVGNVVDNDTLTFARSNAVTFGGIISGAGAVLQVGSGVLTLTGVNTYSGETTLQSGVLSINNNHALGTGDVGLDTGTELRGSGTVTLANRVFFAPGNSTLSTNGTLTVTDLDMDDPTANAVFGSVGNAGVVVVAGNGSKTDTATMEVAFGTLRNGGALGSYTSFVASTTVDKGATLSVNDQSMTVADLIGFGAVTLGTKAATVLTLGGGFFSGVISGAGQVNYTGSVTLAGVNTYTGGTTISGGTLDIGNGSTTGSVVGNIVNNGTLILFRSNAFTYAGIISGTGKVTQAGVGVLTLTGNNTYTGGTTLEGSTTLVNNTTGSGTGTSGVAVDGGATLGGKGTIAGVITVNSGGILAPGAGTPGVPGTKLHTASVVWNGGGTFEFQLGSTADELIMSGTLIKNTAGTFTIDLLKAGTLAQNYTLMTFSGTNFSASDFTLELPAGYSATLVETGTSLSLTSLMHGEEPAAGVSPTPGRSDTPDDLTSSFSPGSDSSAAAGLSVSPAPEPGSAALLAFGGAALLGWRRRRS
jgi:fibronectin-binding autotransporter adhesin